MGPVAGRTAPAGVRNRAGPKMGAGKRVVAAVGAGRRARGPGRAQMAAAAVGIGLGRKRAASVLVSCFCKASFDLRILTASAACFCSLLCWLEGLGGFPARRSLCLLLLRCCLSWVSELTWS